MRAGGRILVAWIPTLLWFWVARATAERVIATVTAYTMPVVGLTLTYVVIVAIYLASFLVVFETGHAFGLWLWPKYKIKR
jgi:hypothetical protein